MCIRDRQYRVTAPVKAELVQQFAVDIITSGQTSGSKISSELKERCNIAVPARTVRHHLAQMGLREIKESLPQLLAVVKKPPAIVPRHETQAATYPRAPFDKSKA